MHMIITPLLIYLFIHSSLNDHDSFSKYMENTKMKSCILAFFDVSVNLLSFWYSGVIMY